MGFLYRKCLWFELNFTDINIGSHNGLELNMQTAITWTNADPVNLHIYALSGTSFTNMV